MTRDETKMVLEILSNIYPNEFRNKSEEQMVKMLNLWSDLMTELDVNLVANAIKMIAISDPSPFMPTIGLINKKVYELTNPNELTEQEAWNHIYKAICNSGYSPQAEYDKLPNVLKSMTSPQQLREWSQMDTSQIETVVASNFMRSYKVRANNVKQHEMLPNSIKKMLENVANQMSIEQNSVYNDEKESGVNSLKSLQ